jgi:uncharacterized membrane protein
MQSSTIIFISTVIMLSVFSIFIHRHRWRDPAYWVTTLLIAGVAIGLLASLNNIFCAGVHAATLGVQRGIFTDSYRDGIINTMQGIDPSRFYINLGIIVLTAKALIPNKERKNALHPLA